MVKKTGPTNIVLRRTIRELKKTAKREDAPIWRYVAEKLESPARSRPSVNLSKINRYTVEGDVVVVPGKVLASGNLDHKVKIAAASFSLKAIEKIENSGGEAVHIIDLVRENPKGSNVKIII